MDPFPSLGSAGRLALMEFGDSLQGRLPLLGKKVPQGIALATGLHQLLCRAHATATERVVPREGDILPPPGDVDQQRRAGRPISHHHRLAPSASLVELQCEIANKKTAPKPPCPLLPQMGWSRRI